MSPNHPTAKVAESKRQKNWVDEKLPDLKTLARELRAQAIELLAAAESHDAAVELAAQHLGLGTKDASRVVIRSPMGDILIQRSCIHHIVEKRQDARERYVKVALDTLIGPFEVWQVAYTNGTNRLAFIGVYETKRQMLVIVTLDKGKMLWNFMQCDAKSLNKHSHGKLLYKRYTLLPSKEKGHCHQWPCKHA
ncbi:PBECR2 nuclease fold domain-containing protein [Pseudomonas sp. NY11382]|uniref:PBECR2 nuclease fold domain-containing protein n=1 Tax=Pseudomonas sp. NY11382 TaxID=2939495 RepID=UPI0022DDA1D2|nr:PBECR2 nuclease fold domain-containing protein [Pseudomonas sp. NY11382]WBM32701.1 PBECR2 nuclease fold domain-containing protein [Pseudomonas sp. NY11382]